MDRNLLLDVFDEYLDEPQEGDIDVAEFQAGLPRMGIDVAEEEAAKLFQVLLENGGDHDGDGYLDRDQFGDFLVCRFEAPQLRAFQDLLLGAIHRIKAQRHTADHQQNESGHTVEPGDGADDVEGQWIEHNEVNEPEDEVSLAEVEMRQAMEQMVSNEKEHHQRRQVLTTRQCTECEGLYIDHSECIGCTECTEYSAFNHL